MAEGRSQPASKRRIDSNGAKRACNKSCRVSIKLKDTTTVSGAAENDRSVGGGTRDCGCGSYL